MRTNACMKMPAAPAATTNIMARKGVFTGDDPSSAKAGLGDPLNAKTGDLEQ